VFFVFFMRDRVGKIIKGKKYFAQLGKKQVLSAVGINH
jgi:hypothetical protein